MDIPDQWNMFILPPDPASNPKIVLRGWWNYAHQDSIIADETPEGKLAYMKKIHRLAENFPCEECATHFKKYLSIHPPEEAKSMGIYMWEFHNEVNRRLGKPIMDLTTFTSMYKDRLHATCATCGGNPQQPRKQINATHEFIWG